MERKCIIGIDKDDLIGCRLKLYLINSDKNPGFFPVVAQLSNMNFSKYSEELTESEKQIFKISEEYSDRELFEIFRSKKDKSVKDFLNKLTKEVAEKKIRPFIEFKINKILEILRESQTELFLKNMHGYIDSSSKIEYYNSYAESLFCIIRQENETKYYLSIKQNGTEINLKGKDYFVLTGNPANVVVEKKLYSFKNLEAKKLLPFFGKDHIIVPQDFEKKWFKNFALPNIGKHQIKPIGFDISNYKPEKFARLEMTRDIDSETVISLKFIYGKHEFFANTGDKSKVELLEKEGSFEFIRFERDIKWENQKSEILKSLGLIQKKLAFFIPEKIEKYESDKFKILDWLKNNRSKIKNEGFDLDLSFEDENYVLSNFKLLSKAEEYTDWFDIKAKLFIDGFEFPFSKLRKNILEGNRELKLPNGEIALIPWEWFEKYSDIFNYGEVKGEVIRFKKHQFRVLEKNPSFSGNNLSNKLKKLSEDIFNSDVDLPQDMDKILRDYQKDGVRWMYVLQKHGFGACLADDMGLGKTLQTLTLIKKVISETDFSQAEKPQYKEGDQLDLFSSESNNDSIKISPVFLIVMPKSLVHNWKNEISKFTPDLKTLKYTGIDRAEKFETISDYDIVLTTYGTVRKDIDKLKDINFHYLILDESQHIKNPSSKIYQAVNNLSSQKKLVLTGTPIENSISDLWAQLNFLNQGLLSNYNFFKREFILPVEKYNNEEKEKKLFNIIKPFILRRTKNQVAKELPQKTEQIVYCDMSDDQNSYYEKEKSAVRNSILNKTEQNESSSIHVLQALSRLRQVANHPLLVDEQYEGESGKFNEICSNIDNLISGNHKVLVFSSYKKHLSLIENFLLSKNYKYSVITGETNNRELQTERFSKNEDVRVFLIQIKAGGFGLNLTAADYVMILDPWWNPAVEDQAVNRAHRIGQDKSLMIYRFISVGTVEEKIKKLQNRKAKLADTFIKSSESLKNLSKEEISELFK